MLYNTNNNNNMHALFAFQPNTIIQYMNKNKIKIKLGNSYIAIRVK